MSIQKWLSYFVPITVYQKYSKINNNLEITWQNGQLVLDSLHANFSYGSLQKVLRHGLKSIGYNHIKLLENCLILGVAGGSVIKTLIDEIQFEGHITGVEIDPETIHLGNTYFGLDKIKKLNIIIADANEFIQKNETKFDLIIIDVFEDHLMPSFLFEKEFLKNTQQALTKSGVILFNTIVINDNEQLRNDSLEKKLSKLYTTIKKLSNIEGYNELFIFKN
jgi:spermidine synthase